MTETQKLKQNLKKMKERYETEREKVKAYKQIIQIHSAYMSVLLKALDATEEKPFEFTNEGVTKALENIDAMAIPTENGFKMFYVEKENENA